MTATLLPGNPDVDVVRMERRSVTVILTASMDNSVQKSAA